MFSKKLSVIMDNFFLFLTNSFHQEVIDDRLERIVMY